MITANRVQSNYAKRLVLLNRYYKITQFYSFLKNTAYKGAIGIGLFVLVLVGLEYFFIDIHSLLDTLVENYSSTVILSTFFTSEVFFGLIPPEIFIAWASKSFNPWLILGVIATASYLGGMVAYFIGYGLSKIPSVKNYLEVKVAKHINNLQKWGGFFIILGAVTPLPHSIVSMSSGMIRFGLKDYLLFALFRYVRFAIYGLVIFQVL